MANFSKIIPSDLVNNDQRYSYQTISDLLTFSRSGARQRQRPIYRQLTESTRHSPTMLQQRGLADERILLS